MGSHLAESPATHSIHAPTPRKYHRSYAIPWLRADPSKVASPKAPPAYAPLRNSITNVSLPPPLSIPSSPRVPIPPPPEVGAGTPDEERPRRPLEGNGSRELGPADLDLLPSTFQDKSPTLPTVHPHPPLPTPTMLHPELRHRVSGAPARANALAVRRPAGVEKLIQARRPLVAPSECPLSLSVHLLSTVSHGEFCRIVDSGKYMSTACQCEMMWAATCTHTYIYIYIYMFNLCSCQ